MADIEKNVNIVFNTNAEQVTSQVNDLAAATDKLDSNTDSVATSSNKLAKASNSVASSMSNTTTAVTANGGAMGLLNMATGGVAQSFKDALEASTLFGGGLSGSVLNSIKKFSIASKVLLASTGIGLLLVAVATLATYWDDIKALVSGVSVEQDKLNKKTDANVLAQEDSLKTLEGQENILKLQGKSETEILNLKIKQKKELVAGLEAQLVQQAELRKTQVETAKRNKSILSGILEFLTFPIAALLRVVDAVGTALGKDFGLSDKLYGTVSNLIFDPEEIDEEGAKAQKATEDRLNAIKNSIAGDQISINKIREDGNNKAKEQRQKAYDEELKARQEQNKKLEDLEKKLLDDLANLEAKSEQDKLNLAKKREEDALKDVKLSTEEKAYAQLLINEKYGILQKELTDKLELDRTTNLQAILDTRKLIEKSYNDQKSIEEIDAYKLKVENDLLLQQETDLLKLEELNATEEQIQAVRAFYNEKKLENEKQASDASLAIDNIEKEQKEANKQDILATADALIDGIKSISNKNKGIQKTAIIAEGAMALGKVGVNIATGVSKDAATGAVASIPQIAKTLATGVFAATSVISNTKKALSALGGGGGGSAPSLGGAGASGASAQPNVNFVTSSENQIGTSVARSQGEQAPIKTYVLSKDVNTQAEFDRNIESSASLG